jgi:hypothetical protein
MSDVSQLGPSHPAASLSSAGSEPESSQPKPASPPAIGSGLFDMPLPSDSQLNSDRAVLERKLHIFEAASRQEDVEFYQKTTKEWATAYLQEEGRVFADRVRSGDVEGAKEAVVAMHDAQIIFKAASGDPNAQRTHKLEISAVDTREKFQSSQVDLKAAQVSVKTGVLHSKPVSPNDIKIMKLRRDDAANEALLAADLLLQDAFARGGDAIDEARARQVMIPSDKEVDD